jgi:hypothetical protein
MKQTIKPANQRSAEKQTAQKTRKAKRAGKVLWAVMAGATALTAAGGAIGCDTGTNGQIYLPQTQTPAPTVQDITIPYGGKTITVKGLMSNDLVTRKNIKDAVDLILENSGGMIDTFKSYAQTKGLTITVENVPVYDSGWDFRIIDDDEFAMRYDFVSTEIVSNIMLILLSTVNNMNDTYHIVP